MEPDHAYYSNIVDDPRYADGPSKDAFPMFESLKLTIERTLPYWNDVIVPQIKSGKKILIAAHGNSLRGIPFYYELDENMKPVKSLQFLGDEETVKAAMEKVAAQ